MEIKTTNLIVGGLAIALAVGIRNDAIPEGHIEVSTPAQLTLAFTEAPYSTNVATQISSVSFKFLRLPHRE
ncbi:MAG TPA: hypothetical protein VEJ46_00955 [Candidatus Acidoferrum sp.]|nr:hypothetical protein [Candidatus Acidoferrum sp.]